MDQWVREEWRGRVGLLHGRPMPCDGRRRISVLVPTRPAVVLGSATPDPFGIGHASHFDVTRRRSGGGLVWLDPQESVWLDVFVPSGDRLWCSDVSRAFHWLGDRLAAAFCELGIDASAHHGEYIAAASGDMVCFASLGPGEVTVGGRKLVGMSQRRTRWGARFQCVCYRRHSLGPLRDLLQEQVAEQISGFAVGWADLGLEIAPAHLAERLIGHVTAPAD